MALEGTHIQFALDVKDQYDIGRLDVYLSGTVYPDSRYISGVDRPKTHPKELLEKTDLTDFETGWKVHLICDRTMSQVTEGLFPELLNEEGVGLWKSPWWVSRTALKSLVDIELMKQFDIHAHLPSLDYVETPFEESEEKMHYYNEMIRELYSRKEITIDDIKWFWDEFQIGEKLSKDIEEKTREFAADKEIMEKVRMIYPDMLDLARG